MRPRSSAATATAPASRWRPLSVPRCATYFVGPRTTSLHRRRRASNWKSTRSVAQAAVDRFGNARGGVPSPFLDVPIARYEAHSTPGPVCALAGREAPLPYEVLANRYGDLQTYLAEFTISLDEIIRGGLPARRRSGGDPGSPDRQGPSGVRMTVTTVPVPETLEQALSPEWLTAALQPRFPGIEVSAVAPGPVVDRISTNARFSIECAGGVPDGLSPALVCQGLLQRNRPCGPLCRRAGSRFLPRPRRGDRGAHAAQRVRRHRPGHAARRRHHRGRCFPGRNIPGRQQPLHARPNRPDARRIRPPARGNVGRPALCRRAVVGAAAGPRAGSVGRSRPPSTSSAATSTVPTDRASPRRCATRTGSSTRTAASRTRRRHLVCHPW